MARTALTPVALSQDAGVDAKAATIMTSIAGLVALGASIIRAAVPKDGKYLIHVKNTAGTEKTVTISSGIGPRNGIGDLEVAVALTSGEQFIVVESSRFKQADGAIYIDFDAGTTGLIAVYELP